VPLMYGCSGHHATPLVPSNGWGRRNATTRRAKPGSGQGPTSLSAGAHYLAIAKQLW